MNLGDDATGLQNLGTIHKPSRTYFPYRTFSSNSIFRSPFQTRPTLSNLSWSTLINIPASQMFRVPPAPFQLKQSSFQPIIARPLHPGMGIKLQNDRSSTNEPDSHDEVIPESPANTSQRPVFRNNGHSALNPVPGSGQDGVWKHKKHRKKKKKKKLKDLRDRSSPKDSFDAQEEEAPPDIIRKLLVATTQEDSARIPTPPPTTESRKRKEVDVLDAPRSKKHKKSEAKKSAVSTMKETPHALENRILDLLATGEEKKRRKRKQKAGNERLKDEQRPMRTDPEQKEQESDQKNETVEQEHEIPGADVIGHTHPNGNYECPTQEHESQEPSHDFVQEEPVEPPSGKPARKRNITHVEIPATQDMQEGEIPDAQSSFRKETATQEPDRLSTPKPAAKSKAKARPSVPQSSLREEPPIQHQSHQTTPKRGRKGKSDSRLSEAIIVDSSAEDEDIIESRRESQIDRPGPPSKKVVPKTKKPRQFKKSRKSAERGNATPGKFSREEDEMIHKFVATYKKTKSLTDDGLESEIRTKEGRQAISTAITASGESWGRDPCEIIRRIGRLYTSLWNSGERGKGPYTRDEDDIIKEQVEAFVAGKHWSMKTFQDFVERNESRKKKEGEMFELVGEILKNLPERDRTSVNRRLVTLYSERNIGSNNVWTTNDDKELKILLAQYGQKWTIIGKAMGRPPGIIRLRYKDYASLGENRSLGKWEEAEEQELLKIVHSILRESTWEAEEGFDVDVMSKYLNWGVVSGMMGTRSRLQCRDKWKIWNRMEEFDFGAKMDELEARLVQL